MSTLFVSDLHLDSAYPDACAHFAAFLQGEARHADALYVLGDLFESWIGDDDAEPARAAVCAELQSLTRNGVPCYVMHGNRDFLLGSGFAERSGCHLLTDPTVVELYGQRALLTHGDALCSGDLAYQRLRASVRRPGWQRRFLALPRDTRGALADAARAGSRAHIHRTVPQIMDVTPAVVVTTMQACGVRLLIHGHTHRPAVHHMDIDGRAATRIVLGAWYEQGSVLRFDADRYALETLARGGPE